MSQRDRSEYFKQYEQSRKERKHAYNQQYYKENALSVKESTRRRAKEIKEYVWQLKVGLSCKRCGITDWRVLDFHHRDKTAKEFGISYAYSRGWSNERIMQEIAKCDVLCANCHRILHWEERDSG